MRWCLLTTCPGLASYPNWDQSKLWGAISPGDGRFAVEQISYASSSCTLSLHQQAKYGILVVLGRRITKTQSLAGAPSELLGFTQTIGIVTGLLILARVGLSSCQAASFLHLSRLLFTFNISAFSLVLIQNSSYKIRNGLGTNREPS